MGSLRLLELIHRRLLLGLKVLRSLHLLLIRLVLLLVHLHLSSLSLIALLLVLLAGSILLSRAILSSVLVWGSVISLRVLLVWHRVPHLSRHLLLHSHILVGLELSLHVGSLELMLIFHHLYVRHVVAE